MPRAVAAIVVVVVLLVACGDQRSYQEKSNSIFSTFEAKRTPEPSRTPTRIPPLRPTPAKCEQFTQASKLLACQATEEAAQQEYRATVEAP